MTSLRSRIYTGKIHHKRLQPVEHVFDYPVYFYCFDLDELDRLDREVPLFSRNRFNLVSFYDADYLGRGEEPLRGKLQKVLDGQGFAERPERVELITAARFLGHVFNPVSFFYGYGKEDRILFVLAQVNNTFGETHLYFLPAEKGLMSGSQLRLAAAKEFHVSPFFDRTGEYDFRFSLPGEEADIHVNLTKEGKPVLLSRLWGKAGPFNGRTLAGTLLRYPAAALLTLPRIHWQAAKLYFGKKLPIFRKPDPESPMTVRTRLPGFVEKFSLRIFDRFLSRMREGRLEVMFPDGSVKVYGTGEAPCAALNVRRFRFFTRILRDSGIGLGEGYTAGDWESPDVTAFLSLLIRNKPYLQGNPSFFSRAGDFLNTLRHRRRHNSLRQSRQNIQSHYDLGNEMYRLFLDESMTYSSGVYESPEDDLARAQQNKLKKIIDKARLTPDCHVLEIGSGWGGFAVKAARETGCRVTGITLSTEQLAWARKKAEEAGLDSRVDFKICDYRRAEGRYDRIVSIEMLEAVGHEYLEDYFRACERLLKPDGLALIQVITIPDQRYQAYRKSCDWIQKHIFPGGHLPSLEVLTKAMTKSSGFFVENLENIGVHYARTLHDWRERFLASSERILELGFTPQAVKAWDYYFSYCEAAFACRHLNVVQLVLTRAGNRTLDGREGAIHAGYRRTIG